MAGYVDFHTHILPGVDHGCKDLTVALKQLSLCEMANIDTVIASSHFYPHLKESDNFVRLRDEAYHNLVESYHGAVRVVPAAEVLLCEGLNNHPDLPLLCIGKSRNILIELPAAPWSKRHLDTLLAIKKQGYKIILAHIDRYPFAKVFELLEYGLSAQVNAGAFYRMWGTKKLTSLIDQGIVCALGSDLHGADIGALEDYQKAMVKLGVKGDRLQKQMRMLIHGC